MKNKHLHSKRALRTTLFVLLLSVVGMTKVYAYDFSAVCETGQTLYYNITNAAHHYVALTCPGNNGWSGFTKPTGDIILPESVQYDGVSYSVTSIGNYAFCSCDGLTGNLIIPNSVTSIDSYTFYGCSGIISIEFPNSVTSIGNYAFSWCTGLTSIVIPNSMSAIGQGNFCHCSGLTSIEIPNSVTSIGIDAFADCTGLTSIEIPNSVTTIDNAAFYGCSGLTSIEIPNSVTSISASAFVGCSSLEQIIVDSGNTVYDSRDNCNAIIYTSTNKLVTGCKNTVIPNSVTSIGSSAFKGCSGLTSIEIPNSVVTIGDNAFRDCSGLTSIEIPSSVTSIDSWAFEYCSGLTFIEIPNSMISIGRAVFSHCSGLTSIGIPNSVTSIGDYAFSYCSGLTSIEIPNSVTSIGSAAFSDCTGLTSMTILADNPPTLGNDVFGHDVFYDVNKWIPVYVTCESVEVYTTVNWAGFNNFVGLCGGEITVTANPIDGGMVTGGGNYGSDTTCTLTAMANPDYSFINWTKDGVMISSSETYSFYVVGDASYVANFAEGTTIMFADTIVKALCVSTWDTDGDGELSYAEAAAVTDLGTVFKNNSNITSFNELQYFIGLGSIGSNAFGLCRGLTTIEIPNSVTSIGYSAFSGCSGLTTIEIPNSVTSIGYSAFSGCTDLTFIEISNSLTSIGGSAFYNCYRLTSIELPNSVTSIGSWAFNDCGLTSIKIPNSVTSIEYFTFYQCVRLTSIEIPNSVTSIGSSAFSGCIRLTSIEIPNSVTSIGSSAFSSCNGLTSMTVIGDNPPQLESQAFDYVNKFIPVYVPCESVDTYTTTNWGGFNNFVGLCGGEITVMAHPAEGGTVTGGGYYGSGATCELIATANSGYSFINWTKDGVGVSNSDTCSFYVAGDGSYVANFVRQGTTITFADPSVKSLCVANWDTDGDGELSYAEVAVVTDLGRVFYNSDITSFDELQYFVGLTTIDYFAFSGCSSLTSIVIPSSATSICDYAFNNCSGLTSIRISNSVISIGYEAFYSCSGLTSMTVLADNPPTIGDNAFYDVSMGIPVYVPCGSVEAYTTANWGGFNNFVGFCGGEITVTANPAEGGTVTGGGYYGADTICTLTAMANPGFTFINWTKDGVGVSHSVTYSFYVAGDVSYVANFARGTTITFAEANVKALCVANWDTDGDGELSYAEAATVTNLGVVFKNKSNITTFNELQYFVGLTSIGSSAFSSCNGLISIEIPNSVTSISSYAFSGCSRLTSIEIPNSVTLIGSSAFSGCSGLTSMTVLADNPPTIINSAFYNVNMGIPVYVPCGSVEAYTTANWGGFNNFVGFCGGEVTVTANPAEGGTVTGGGYYGADTICTLTATANPDYSFVYWAKDGVRVSDSEIFNFYVAGNTSYVAYFVQDANITFADSTVKVLCVANWDTDGDGELSYAEAAAVRDLGIVFKNNSNITTFDELQYFTGLTSIRYEAFSSCSGLTSIVIPNSVTSINYRAFYNCSSLTSIEIPDSMTSIGYAAFSGCTGLTSMIVLADNPPTLGNYAFYNVITGIPVYVPCGSIEAYTMANWGGFNNFVGLCAAGEITVTTHPAEGGTVEGGGYFEGGTTCTIIATPNTGYCFVNWTENGSVVSSDASYSFVINGDRNLVANFIEGVLISDGGTATNEYLPSNAFIWYSLTQQIYTADEIGSACTITSISFFNEGAEKTLSYDFYLVATDKTSFNSFIDWMPVSDANKVFSGEVTMVADGWTIIDLDTPFEYDGTSNIVLVTDDNTGHYTFAPNMACRVFDAQGYQTICVSSYDTNYDPSNPFSYYGTRIIVKNQIMFGIIPSTTQQTMQLSQSWNWFSTNVEITLDDLKAALVEAMPGSTIIITSQSSGSTTYNGIRWRGNLSTIDVAQMYKISVDDDCEITLTGTPVDPAGHPVTISNGANWIAFPLNETMTLSDAFAGFAVSGDMVTSQSGTATYNGTRWRGTISNLEPGKGYVYTSGVTGIRTLIFPTSAK